MYCGVIRRQQDQGDVLGVCLGGVNFVYKPER